MKSLNVTKIILTGIGILGGILVAQGVLTGSELIDIQNVTGLALSGGAITSMGVIAVLQLIPKTLVTKGYDKAVELYGKPKVDGFINKIDDVFDTMTMLDKKLDGIIAEQNIQKEQRDTFLNTKV